MMGDTKTTLLSNGQRGALDYFWEHLGLGQVFELALPATIFNSAELVALFDEYAPFPEAAQIAGEPAGTDGRFASNVRATARRRRYAIPARYPARLWTVDPTVNSATRR